MTSIDIPILEDTSFNSTAVDTNYSGSSTILVGESNADSAIWRGWMKPDFSSIPAGQMFTSAILKLTPAVDRASYERVMNINRCLRNVVYNQATQNVYSTGNNWSTAGCSNPTTDYDGSIAIGTYTAPADPTLNVQINITLNATELQKLYDFTNNGFVLFMNTQSNDLTQYHSYQAANEAYRPIITIDYMPKPAAGVQCVNISGFGIL